MKIKINLDKIVFYLMMLMGLYEMGIKNNMELGILLMLLPYVASTYTEIKTMKNGGSK